MAENGDIAPELWEEIKRQFLQDVENDEKIEDIIAKMAEKMATHVDSQEYAIQVGEHAADALQNVLSSDVLPEGKMYYNIAERTVRPQMELIREMVLETAGEIQEALNWKASLGMKAIAPPANDDRIEGIINRLCSEENYDKIKWILDAPIKAYSQSVVDDFIRANADFQSKAGLNPKIVRTLRGKGCEWCRKLAGTYDYYDVSDTGNDVFRRHDNCRCTVTYDPRDGRIQDAHTKRWYDSNGMSLYKADEKRMHPSLMEVAAEYRLSLSTSNDDTDTLAIPLGYIDTSVTAEAMEYFSNEIRNESTENAIVIEKDGKVTRFISKKSYTCNFGGVELAGAHITHNHPPEQGDILSFGKDDFELYQAHPEIEQLMACNSRYNYYLSVTKSLNDVSYSEIYKEAMYRKLSDIDSNDEPQDIAMQILQERGYCRYEKKRIK